MKDLWGEGNGKYGLDTYVNCAEKIEKTKEKYKITSKKSTNAVYCSKNRRENEKLLVKLRLAKEYFKDGVKYYEDFTDEELDIKLEVWRSIFCEEEDMNLKEQRKLYTRAYKKGEITEEEFREKIAEICEIEDNKDEYKWVIYLAKLEELFHCKIKRVSDIAESSI